MALRSMTVHRYDEIRRRLAEGRSLREIARALGCSRRTVRDVRDGERRGASLPRCTEGLCRSAKFTLRPAFEDIDFTASRSIRSRKVLTSCPSCLQDSASTTMPTWMQTCIWARN
jgi:transcriptional regulator with XRE-family HTH domain